MNNFTSQTLEKNKQTKETTRDNYWNRNKTCDNCKVTNKAIVFDFIFDPSIYAACNMYNQST